MVVGAAFTAVVTAFTGAFLKPLIQVFSGGGQFAGTFTVRGVVFDYASFINAVITFLLTAAVIYFLVVWPLQVIAERRKRGEEAGPAESTDVELLKEIRDLLARDAGNGTGPGTAAAAGEITECPLVYSGNGGVWSSGSHASST